MAPALTPNKLATAGREARMEPVKGFAVSDGRGRFWVTYSADSARQARENGLHVHNVRRVADVSDIPLVLIKGQIGSDWFILDLE